MQFLLLTQVKRLFVATSLLFLLCSLAVSSRMSPGALAHSTLPQATVYKSLTKGTIAPLAIADPRHPPVQQAATQRPPRETKGVRRIPHPLTASAQTVGQAKAQAIPQARTGQILQNFNGVSSLDSENTNFGAEFEPPDQGLCVGNGFVIDAVNSAFTISHLNGKPILGPLNINVLFAEGLTQFTSDPRCYFDKSTHTWVAIILFIGTDSAGNFTNESRTDIAVNNSGDPTTPWTIYHLEASDDGTGGMPQHTGCPCLGDQPLLGIDQENLSISTNEFSIQGSQFNGAQIYAISKRQLFVPITGKFGRFLPKVWPQVISQNRLVLSIPAQFLA